MSSSGEWHGMPTLAWTLYGYCHHTITYLKSAGQIVGQE
jgi:hypothetical protein